MPITDILVAAELWYEEKTVLMQTLHVHQCTWHDVAAAARSAQQPDTQALHPFVFPRDTSQEGQKGSHQLHAIVQE